MINWKQNSGQKKYAPKWPESLPCEFRPRGLTRSCARGHSLAVPSSSQTKWRHSLTALSSTWTPACCNCPHTKPLSDPETTYSTTARKLSWTFNETRPSNFVTSGKHYFQWPALRWVSDHKPYSCGNPNFLAKSKRCNMIFLFQTVIAHMDGHAIATVSLPLQKLKT